MRSSSHSPPVAKRNNMLIMYANIHTKYIHSNLLIAFYVLSYFDTNVMIMTGECHYSFREMNTDTKRENAEMCACGYWSVTQFSFRPSTSRCRISYFLFEKPARVHLFWPHVTDFYGIALYCSIRATISS